jgi:GT2 family glycosyltransferase
LTELVNVAASKSDIGLVNPSSNNLGQYTERGSIDSFAERSKPFKGQYIEMGACIGFCMLIKRELIERIGYFDEIYTVGNFDDTDYSRKAEKEGYVCVRAKGAYVYHHMKSSFLKIKSYEESFKRNQYIYNSRWGQPKRFLYIVTGSHGKLFSWMSEDIIRKCRGGNWVWLFLKKGEALPEIREHSNMKVSYIPAVFFGANCIIRILKKKKGFDFIFADNTDLINRIKKYARFHGAEASLMGG